MRAVWAVIAVLVVLAAVLVFRPPESPNISHARPFADSSMSSAPTATTSAGDHGSVQESGGGDRLGAASSAPPPAPTQPAEATETIRRVDTRSVVLAGRFEVIGNGTERDPYRVKWDVLATANEGMAPDGSQLVPPPWIAAIDGSWIEIAGYVSTPVVAETTSEVLFTKNRWDGCCIGIPPTPFDSIEVRLAQPLAFSDKHALRFGVLRGRLSVSPWVLAGVVLGVYRLEHGAFTTRAE